MRSQGNVPSVSQCTSPIKRKQAASAGNQKSLFLHAELTSEFFARKWAAEKTNELMMIEPQLQPSGEIPGC
jgi:hypothetical protein